MPSGWKTHQIFLWTLTQEDGNGGIASDSHRPRGGELPALEDRSPGARLPPAPVEHQCPKNDSFIQRGAPDLPMTVSGREQRNDVPYVSTDM